MMLMSLLDAYLPRYNDFFLHTKEVPQSTCLINHNCVSLSEQVLCTQKKLKWTNA